MKLHFSFSTSVLIIAFFCLANLSETKAQRYLTEKRPDLALISATVKKNGTDQLNVIWSIKNNGDADAQLLGANREPLVSYLIEGSGKKEARGVQHTWREVSRSIALECEKSVLKPGEVASGSFALPYIEQESLVSYRFSLDPNNVLAELKKDNNSIIAVLIGQ